MLTKVKRDQIIMDYLKRFKVCSRNQLAYLICQDNSNPINVINRVMKRLVTDGLCLPIRRTKEKCYLYTRNPSDLHHKSNKLDHCLAIVDFYIQNHCPDKFVVEPKFGDYIPDVFFEDKTGKHLCVEIQLTPISHAKMQDKINRFVESSGVEHDSKIMVLCSEYSYPRLKLPSGFRLVKMGLPKEVNM